MIYQVNAEETRQEAATNDNFRSRDIADLQSSGRCIAIGAV